MATHPSSGGGARRYPVPIPMQKASRKVRIVEADAMDVDVQKRREVKTVGEVSRVTGTVAAKVYHFRAFEVNGVRVNLEDFVLITPSKDEAIEKLHVAIIKDITQDPKTRKVTARVQWLYRPEEAKKEGGGSWVKDDSRLLYYSFQYHNIAAESVMHPCIVHFIPWYKRLPDYRKHPGFVVRNLYDVNKKKLVKLTDILNENDRRDEIYLLLAKTMERLGDLPDSQAEDMSLFYRERVEATKTLLRNKREIPPTKVLPEKVGPSKYHTILLGFNALTNEEWRNKRLEKLLQALEQACTEGENQLIWPDSAVSAATALEKACNETCQNFTKYNQKMRSLEFNLEKHIVLARRFLKQEFGPSILMKMSPVQMKEGLTPEEFARTQSEEPPRIQLQMTDARCKVCSEKKVGLVSTVRAGYKDRYKLECQLCGTSWYASGGEFSIVTTTTTNAPNDTPPATAKLQGPEKKDEQRRP